MKLLRLSYRLRGDSLIEVAIALGVVAILLTITTISITTSLGNAQESKNRNQATAYAQQAIEVTRQMRDTSWTSFSSLNNATYCMADTCTQVSNTAGSCGPKVGSSCGKNVGNFSREVSLTTTASCPTVSTTQVDNIKVTVKVAWESTACISSGNPFCKAVTLESCLSNF